jgi:hypothetical protein
MSGMNGRPLTWPSWERLAAGLSGGFVVSLAFFPIYAGCGVLAEFSASPWRLYADWELAIPFWPFMVVPYLSMFVLFVVPPLQLEAVELRDLAQRLVVASLLGGTVLLLLPTQMGFTERTDAGIWQGLYDAIYRVDNRFDLVPSFHVIYTASILLSFIQVASRRLRFVYAAWLILVCASTVLTHRHHLLDVGAGLVIAVSARALVPRRGPSDIRGAMAQGGPHAIDRPRNRVLSLLWWGARTSAVGRGRP